MDKEQKFIVSIIAIISTAVVIFATSMNYFYTKRMTVYISNGYCESTALGMNGTVIKKCE